MRTGGHEARARLTPVRAGLHTTSRPKLMSPEFKLVRKTLLDCCARIGDRERPSEVLEELNQGLLGTRKLRVLGAGRFPWKSGDWDRVKLGETLFLHKSVGAKWWRDYSHGADLERSRRHAGARQLGTVHVVGEPKSAWSRRSRPRGSGPMCQTRHARRVHLPDWRKVDGVVLVTANSDGRALSGNACDPLRGRECCSRAIGSAARPACRRRCGSAASDAA